MKPNRTLKNICAAYCLIVVAGLLGATLFIPHFEQVGHLTHGCYWFDAMVPGIECKGLPLNSAVKLFFNYWLNMIYMIVFIVTLPIALVMWMPVIYLAWYFVKTRNRSRHPR